MSTSHHQSEDDQDALRRFVDQSLKRAERHYPKGAINATDEGETAFAFAVDPGTNRLMIHFPVPMRWIGMDLEELDRFIGILQAKRREMAVEDASARLAKAKEESGQ